MKSSNLEKNEQRSRLKSEKIIVMFGRFFKKKSAQIAEIVTDITQETKSESESDVCSVCFDVWTSTGSHRYI